MFNLKKDRLFWDISYSNEIESPLGIRTYITYMKIKTGHVIMQVGSLVCYTSILYSQ